MEHSTWSESQTASLQTVASDAPEKNDANADDLPHGKPAAALLPTQKLALELKQAASHSAPAPLGSADGGKLVSAAALAPKKPNEDLKRELQPALDELAILTQEAITTLVQRRMAAQAEDETQQQAASAQAGSGRPEAAEDQKSSLDGAALARMVEQQAEQQGKHMP